MTTKSNSGKLVAIIIVAIIGAVAGYGYFKQASVMTESEAHTPGQNTPKTTAALAVKPNDIILGDANAMVTIVEYSSLSCSHCAHFHQEVLPTIEKEFITTGKVKLVLRHFPLNAPALKGAVMVECAGLNGLNRANFMKVLFDMQSKWAFEEGFEKNLQQIGRVGGLDSATFDSCMADKELENRIITSRKEGEEVLKIDGTPTFYIDGILYTGDRTVEGFRDAIKTAMKVDAAAAASKPEEESTAAPAPAAKVPEAATKPAVQPAKNKEENSDDIQSEETED